MSEVVKDVGQKQIANFTPNSPPEEKDSVDFWDFEYDNSHHVKTIMTGLKGESCVLDAYDLIAESTTHPLGTLAAWTFLYHVCKEYSQTTTTMAAFEHFICKFRAIKKKSEYIGTDSGQHAGTAPYQAQPFRA